MTIRKRHPRIYLLDGKEISSSDCGGFVHTARKERISVLMDPIKKGERYIRFNSWKMGNEIIELEQYVFDHDEGNGVILGVKFKQVRKYGIIRNAVICEKFFKLVKVDVFVVFTPLCKIKCYHFSTFFDKHGHGNSQSCINNGGILEDLDASRFSDGKLPVGCPHFPQEVMKKNRRMLDFHQAYGVLCYKYTGRYEGCYQEIQEET